jgi:hypothetical protein
VTRSSVYARAPRREPAVLLEDLEAGRRAPSEAERDFAEAWPAFPGTARITAPPWTTYRPRRAADGCWTPLAPAADAPDQPEPTRA